MFVADGKFVLGTHQTGISAAGTSSFATRSLLSYQATNETAVPGPGTYASLNLNGSALSPLRRVQHCRIVAATLRHAAPMDEPQRCPANDTTPPVDVCVVSFHYVRHADSLFSFSAVPSRRSNGGTNAFRSVTHRSKGSFLDFKNTTPAPGAYEEVRRAVSVPSRRGAVSAAPFAATSLRFGKDDTVAPGPGNYRADQLTSLANQVSSKLHSKGGAFGTAAVRFEAANAARPASPRATPATSEATRPIPVFGADTSKKAPVSSFASTSKRFRPVTAPVAKPEVLASATGKILGVKGDPEKLGPGRYELASYSDFKPAVPAKGRSNAAFGAGAERVAGARSATVLRHCLLACCTFVPSYWAQAACVPCSSSVHPPFVRC